MRYERSAGVIVSRIAYEGYREYLLLRTLVGAWDFPKGKMEPGEEAVQTALRETHEEAGLSVTLATGFQEAVTYCFKDRSGTLVSKQVIFFLGEPHQQEARVRISDEHCDFKWADYQTALDFLSFENSRQLLRQAEKHLKKQEQTGNN
jgi:8-oxo-dGTP pyrophosphatase MutT (NUDIX family)